jgi:phage shock protein PspC (stress-responsive transcriptional regulator)
MAQLKDLRLSINNKILGGVCAGIAEWLDWDPTTVRLVFIIGSFIPIIPGFVVYLILWILLPKRNQ